MGQCESLAGMSCDALEAVVRERKHFLAHSKIALEMLNLLEDSESIKRRQQARIQEAEERLLEAEVALGYATERAQVFDEPDPDRLREDRDERRRLEREP